MNRRQLIKSLLSVAALAFTGKIFSSPYSHTDVDYASTHSAYGHYYPYLNGKIIIGAQAANATEGWIDCYEGVSSKTKRLYGNVQILRPTPERKKEFDAAEVAYVKIWRKR